MQKILRIVLTLTVVSVLILTTACSQAAVNQDSVSKIPEPEGSATVTEETRTSVLTSEFTTAAETEPDVSESSEEEPEPEEVLEIIEDAKVAMSGDLPEIPTYAPTSAPGTSEVRTSDAVIDYSNTSDGYVMVKFTASTPNRIKALVQAPTTTQYQYDIQPGEWAVLPLSEGDGTYQVGVYENVRGTSYAQSASASFNARISDEFAPFLRSNQYVNFESAPETIIKAAELCKGIDDALEKVGVIYDYVVENTEYDYDKAANIKSGYVPDLDDVLDKGTGICLDYAGLMAGMLRSQSVPCKLVVGYTGTAYHAWISVWAEETGWIQDAIYFDGESWQRMDPTFASTGNKSDKTMEYIGDGKNYVAKYFY